MAKSGCVPLLARECRLCRTVFGVCRPCFRGQRYCGKDCRRQARAESHREANRKHQRTPEGREDHRDRQRDLRNRQKQQGVTDQSCEGKAAPRSLPAVEEKHGERDQGDTGPIHCREEQPAKPFCIACGRPGFFIDRRGRDAQRHDRRWPPLQ